MKETQRNFAVGLTAILGLCGLAYLVFVFGDMPKWFDESYPVTVELDTAAGVSKGTRVQLLGVDVGYVEAVALREDGRAGVDLVVRIRKEQDIPAGSRVDVASSFLGGSGSLLIVPPQGPDAPPGSVPREGGRLTGKVTSIASQLSNLAESLGDDLETQLANFGKASEKIGLLADEYRAVGEKLNVLLTQRDPAAVDAGQAPPNLVTVVARTDARLAELKTTLANLNAVLGDERLLADLRATVANAKDATAGATKLTADASVAVTDARDSIAQLSRRYIAVADDLSKSLGRIDALLADAQAGKGTVGKLLTDPALYDAYTDTAHRLDDAIKELTLLIQKWKAEGLPVQF